VRHWLTTSPNINDKGGQGRSRKLVIFNARVNTQEVKDREEVFRFRLNKPTIRRYNMPLDSTPIILFIVLAALALFLSSAIRVFREYERGVVFTLGRFWKVKGPGLVIIIPVIQKVVRVDLRTVVLEVPTQDVISRDNVSVKVSAVVYLRVIDPEKAIIQVVDFLNATSQLAQTMLRSVLGKHQLDDMLAEREKLNTDIQQALDAQTDSWGIKVSNVEIKQVDLTESMIRAIARQAEAERERRAKVIHAEGELQASEKLFQAAKILAQEPQAILLRYLETLTVIGADKNTTIVFPLPMDLVAPLLAQAKMAGNSA
jgi:regulator of protease activity HflC (stomatin/prohibitin superfamily)